MSKRTLVSSSLVLLGLACSAHAQSLFAITNSGDFLRVDTGDGTTTQIGTTGIIGAAGLDRAADGTLYAYSRPDAGTIQLPSALFTLDAASGDDEFVGNLGVDFDFEGGLAVQDATTAYALGGRNTAAGTALFRVDLATGAATEIAGLGIRDINALAMRADGMLVAWSHIGAQLIVIDPTDGTSSQLVTDFSFSGGNAGGLASINGRDAYVLADTVGGSVPQPGALYRVDMFTGAFEFLTQVDAGLEITGIAIPAPYGAALFALGGLAAARRRR